MYIFLILETDCQYVKIMDDDGEVKKTVKFKKSKKGAPPVATVTQRASYGMYAIFFVMMMMMTTTKT